MPEIMIDSDKLLAAGKTFDEAAVKIRAILDDLNRAVTDLEKGWSGATQQVFYKQYSDLKGYLEVFADTSAGVAKELGMLAEEMEKLDKADFKED